MSGFQELYAPLGGWAHLSFWRVRGLAVRQRRRRCGRLFRRATFGSPILVVASDKGALFKNMSPRMATRHVWRRAPLNRIRRVQGSATLGSGVACYAPTAGPEANACLHLPSRCLFSLVLLPWLLFCFMCFSALLLICLSALAAPFGAGGYLTPLADPSLAFRARIRK